MAEAARTGVHDHGDLVRKQTQAVGETLVVDFLNKADLHEVVAAAQRAKLRTTALHRPGTHRARIRALQLPRLFDLVQILRCAVAVANRPVGTFNQNGFQLLVLELQSSRGTHSAGHVVEKGRHHVADFVANLADFQIRAQQPHPAVDVVANTSRRNDPSVHVERGHSSDRKPVPPVNVRHGQRVLLDSGEGRHVRHLLRRVVLADVRDHLLGGVDASRHAHLPLAGNLPHVVVHLSQLVACHGPTSTVDPETASQMPPSNVEDHLRFPVVVASADEELVKRHRLDFQSQLVSFRIVRFAGDLGFQNCLTVRLHTVHLETGEKNPLGRKKEVQLGKPANEKFLQVRRAHDHFPAADRPDGVGIFQHQAEQSPPGRLEQLLQRVCAHLETHVARVID